MIHMTAVGEKAGQLEQMLERVATTYETEVDTKLSRFTALLEPLMLVVMGGAVAFIVFSILQPIMDLGSAHDLWSEISKQIRETRSPHMSNLRRRLAKSFKRAQRGMTLLEIMIVLAILALVMGLVVGPRVMKMFGESKVDIADSTVKKYAYEAYPQWSARTRARRARTRSTDLNEYMNNKDDEGPVGQPVQDAVRPEPAGRRKGGIAVLSSGDDGKEGTDRRHQVLGVTHP